MATRVANTELRGGPDLGDDVRVWVRGRAALALGHEGASLPIAQQFADEVLAISDRPSLGRLNATMGGAHAAVLRGDRAAPAAHSSSSLDSLGLVTVSGSDDLVDNAATGVIHGPAGAGKTFAVAANLERLRTAGAFALDLSTARPPGPGGPLTGVDHLAVIAERHRRYVYRGLRLADPSGAVAALRGWQLINLITGWAAADVRAGRLIHNGWTVPCHAQPRDTVPTTTAAISPAPGAARRPRRQRAHHSAIVTTTARPGPTHHALGAGPQLRLGHRAVVQQLGRPDGSVAR